MEASREAWMKIHGPEDEKTFGDLCKFIADTAEKEVIELIKIMGNYCSPAAIFKSLKKRLEKWGLDVSYIRPSTRLEPLVKKYRGEMIGEINLLDPTALPPINYKINWVFKWGLRLLMVCVVVTILLAYRNSHWALVTGAIGLLGFGMTWLGALLEPQKASFEGLYTVSDLVRKIHQQKGR